MTAETLAARGVKGGDTACQSIIQSSKHSMSQSLSLSTSLTIRLLIYMLDYMLVLKTSNSKGQLSDRFFSFILSKTP